MFIGAPVAFAIGIAGFVFFMTEATMPMSIAVHKIATMSQGFPLLAVPFFVFAGHLMNESGITERLFRFSHIVIAGGDTSPVLQLVEQALDEVAPAVFLPVVRSRPLAVGLGGDHGFDTGAGDSRQARSGSSFRSTRQTTENHHPLATYGKAK